MLASIRVGALTGLALMGFALTGAAQADEGIKKYRHSVYEALGGHTAALAGIVKGEVPFKDDLAGHVRAIEDISKITPKLFPEGSGGGKTEALPVIWEKPEDFKKAMMAFQEAAANLAKAAETDPDGVPAALGALAKTCKGCHDTFRKED
ncbi:MAG: cytochrome c [Rhodospirillales bacterium]|nr:cytochrome c [Rhodospirillales bacterium]